MSAARPSIQDKMERTLCIKPGETTTDNKFSLETVNCVGACALGPVVVIDTEYHGQMTMNKVDKIIGKIKEGGAAIMKKITDAQALRQVQEELKKNYDPNKKLVTICAGTGCRGYGCIKVKEALEAEIKKQNINVEVRATGCFGFCEKGPLVVVHPQKYFYQQVKVKDVADIVSKTVMQGRSNRKTSLPRSGNIRDGDEGRGRALLQKTEASGFRLQRNDRSHAD